MIELLKQLQSKYDLIYMFISHDLKVVKSLCHEIVIMRRGKTVESGPAIEIYAQLEHAYTKELLATAFEN